MKLVEINGKYVYRGAVVAVYTDVRSETVYGYMPQEYTYTHIIVVMDGGAEITVKKIMHRSVDGGATSRTEPYEDVDAAVLDVIQRLGLTVE
jgi:hypothetical protein